MSEEKPKRDPDALYPAILGRFNYFSYTEDLFNIMFVSYVGNNMIMVAKNLTREELNTLRKKLNVTIDEFSEYAENLP